LKLSKKVANVEYAIRDIAIAAKKVEQTGKKVDYLNIGDPVLYGFHTPDNVKEALIKAVRNNENYYSPSEGIPELRAAIAEKEHSKGLSVDGDDILVTNGVSEGLDMVISSIVEDGDEVLLPGPYYPPYASYVRLRGGIPVEFAVDMNNSTPDFDDIRSKITSKTVAICLISPNNPTGVVFNEKSLKEFVEIANENNLYILCDEIYDQIVFDEKFVGIGKVAGDSPVIILNGFSKVHLMTGWRIGYLAFNKSPKLDDIRENLPKLARVRIATNLPVQHAALESLRGPQGYISEFVSELKKRSTDKEFVLNLLESKGVLTVHGSGFGTKYGSGHFRLVFLPKIEILDSALNKIEEFVNQ
jgi:aspartate/methionine/tyrosine aminotransferase